TRLEVLAHSLYYFFIDTAATESSALSLHDALPISPQRPAGVRWRTRSCRPVISCRARRVSAVSIQPGSTALTWMLSCAQVNAVRSEEHTSELQSRSDLVCRLLLEKKKQNKDAEERG